MLKFPFKTFNRKLISESKKYLCTMVDRITLFQSIGLNEQKAKETVKNKSLAERLETVIKKVECFNFIN